MYKNGKEERKREKTTSDQCTLVGIVHKRAPACLDENQTSIIRVEIDI